MRTMIVGPLSWVLPTIKWKEAKQVVKQEMRLRNWLSTPIKDRPAWNKAEEKEVLPDTIANYIASLNNDDGVEIATSPYNKTKIFAIAVIEGYSQDLPNIPGIGWVLFDTGRVRLTGGVTNNSKTFVYSG